MQFVFHNQQKVRKKTINLQLKIAQTVNFPFGIIMDLFNLVTPISSNLPFQYSFNYIYKLKLEKSCVWIY